MAKGLAQPDPEPERPPITGARPAGSSPAYGVTAPDDLVRTD